MTQPLSSIRRLNIINTFKHVKSIRETSIVCKTSRNTVRSILRSSGISNELAFEMKVHGNTSKALKEIPPINPRCDWNPLSSNLYKSLKNLEPKSSAEPWITDNLKNMAILMRTLAEQLKVGNSSIGTLKLEILMRSYMSYCDSEARAAAYDDMIGLQADKRAKIHLMYKEASYKALKTVFEILADLEGKGLDVKNLNLHQNNFSFQVNRNKSEPESIMV